MRSHLVTELAEQTDLTLEPGEWTPEELAHANTLVAKYAGSEWTQRV